MKEHGTLFKGPMVRAILDDRKSQTRRLFTLANSLVDGHGLSSRSQFMGVPAEQFWKALDWENAWVDGGPSPAGNSGPYLKVPYPPEDSVHRIYSRWQVGDRLWVRETWREWHDIDMQCACYDICTCPSRPKTPVCYQADGHFIESEERERYGLKWSPAIHMPRWASRITLEIEDLRIQRLQAISNEDAAAEGVRQAPHRHGPEGLASEVLPGRLTLDPYSRFHSTGVSDCFLCPFKALWQSINGSDNWDASPWVRAFSFRRLPQ